MKTRNSYLFALIFGLALVFIVMPGMSAHGYYYDPSYGGQYTISPLMTSTLPYGYQTYGNGYYAGYSSSYYNNGYYPVNNNYPYYYAGANGTYYDYGYTGLSVNCSANTSFVMQNQPIRWSVNVSGGPTGYYFYNWKGTDNPLSLNSSTISVTYQLPGVKTMSVSVTDPSGRITTAYCGSATVGQYYYPVPYYGY